MTLLPRLQLAELEDQRWFPATIRDFSTDYQRFMVERFGLHRHVFPVLREAIVRTGSSRILDLCSGGGGPCPAIQRELAAAGIHVRFTLTDLFPNVTAFEAIAAESAGEVDFEPEPVDATAVPNELTGFRTFFNSFHHFNPAEGGRILADAVANDHPIAVFEVPQRTALNAVCFLLTPLAVCLVTPFIRPFSWRRLFWTYLVPLVPFTCFWDGIVSHVRAYSASELLEMAHRTGALHYEWHCGESRVPPAPLKVTYLVGHPARVCGAAS